jgi:hypothetical protein
MTSDEKKAAKLAKVQAFQNNLSDALNGQVKPKLAALKHFYKVLPQDAFYDNYENLLNKLNAKQGESFANFISKQHQKDAAKMDNYKNKHKYYLKERLFPTKKQLTSGKHYKKQLSPEEFDAVNAVVSEYGAGRMTCAHDSESDSENELMAGGARHHMKKGHRGGMSMGGMSMGGGRHMGSRHMAVRRGQRGGFDWGSLAQGALALAPLLL